MKKQYLISLITLCLCVFLTACGNYEMDAFREEFEEFCINVSDLDTSINQIDPASDSAVVELLKYTDQLSQQFDQLAEMDFPGDFEFLEKLADEAAEYMKEAASSYHAAYADDSFDASMEQYALQNYKRAYKRVQIILIYLHGEEPTEADLLIE